MICVCGRYKYDSSCKYFLVVVILMFIFCVYFIFIKKKFRKSDSKMVIVEYEVRKMLVGKKGGKNKYLY